MNTFESSITWFEYLKTKSAIRFVQFMGHDIEIWIGSGIVNIRFIVKGTEKAIKLFETIRFLPERDYLKSFFKSRDDEFRT